MTDDEVTGDEPTRDEVELPEWLRPVKEAADAITVHELTRFMPPEGSDARRGAVLMLFFHRPCGLKP